MEIRKIYEKLKELAPLELCESWDNSGFLINMGKETNNVLITLDVTREVVMEAIEKNCNLIISHHPVIFKGIKSLHENDIVTMLIQKGISVISMHTNLDAAEGGVNTALAEIIELEEVEPFATIGRKGELSCNMTVEELAKKVSKVLNTNVKYTNGNKTVHKVAVIGGAAGGYFRNAKKEGCDCFITGEASHHDGVDSYQTDIGLIVAGHFNTEVIVLPKLKEYLENYFPDEKFMVSKVGEDPFKYMPAPKKECDKCKMKVPYILETLTFDNHSICLCLNCMAIAYQNGFLDNFLENDYTLNCDITGKPGAILFECENEHYVLEKETMLRLIARNLQPEEYKKLAEKYSPHNYLLHSDFYTEDGEAIQPID